MTGSKGVAASDTPEDEPLGVLEPQIVHQPPDVYTAEAAIEVIEFSESVGLMLDESQQCTLHVNCGERRDGTWAAYEAGDCESRQNGKGDTKIGRALTGLFVWDEDLMIWTAHEFKTANESFLRLVGVIEGSDELRSKVARIRYANGEQGVELLSGGRLKFAARSGSSGRGFAGVSTLFFDESQHLDAEALAAATGSMAVHPNPQIWLAGSAGLRTSSAWWRMRRRAIRGNGGKMRIKGPGAGGRLGYVEHTAEVVGYDAEGKWTSTVPDATDRRMWAIGNPALGVRISHEFLQGQLNLLGPEKFSREHLTVWDPEPAEVGQHEPKIPAVEWKATLANPRPKLVAGETVVAMGIARCELTGRSAISVAAGSLEEPYVEVVEEQEGIGWLFDRLVELILKWKPKKVGIDAKGPEGALVPTILHVFKAAKIDVELLQQLTTEEYKAACGAFYNDVIDCRLARAAFVSADGARVGQAALDLAVADVGERTMGQGWIFDRRTATVSVAPLISTVVARYLLPAKPPPEKRKTRIHSF
jgi:hypothetical protein